jgi:hypothetical protein
VEAFFSTVSHGRRGSGQERKSICSYFHFVFFSISHFYPFQIAFPLFSLLPVLSCKCDKESGGERGKNEAGLTLTNSKN